MKIGYVRISREEKQLDDLQVDALKSAGCERLYRDALSGASWNRPELHRMLEHLRPGDEVLVWKLDRFARSSLDLLKLVQIVGEAGASFRSLTEPFETQSAGGKMFMTMLAAFAEYEREILRERTKEGLKAARARGRKGGRREVLSPAQQQKIRTDLEAGLCSPRELAELFGVSRTTIWRIAKSAQKEKEAPK